MNDKKLLERLGIIQKMEMYDDSDFTVKEPENTILSDVIGKSSIKSDILIDMKKKEPASKVVRNKRPRIEEIIAEEVIEAENEQAAAIAEAASQPASVATSAPESLTESAPLNFYETPAYSDGIINADRYSSVDELYSIYGKKSSGVDTVYIIEAFSKAMPDTLPNDVKKQSVLNIINASQMNVDELVSDGLARLENLAGFINSFKKRTEEIVGKCDAEIRNLEDRIKVYKREADERNRLQEKQETAIEYETHKVKGILDFITKP